MLKSIFFILLSIIAINSYAKLSVSSISPANWWAGLGNNKVVIMVTGEEISGAGIQFDRTDVRLLRKIPSQNPNYLLLEVEIDIKAQPGVLVISFLENGKPKATADFQILQKNSFDRKPLSNKDIIYQIVPDRFKDGEPANNDIKECIERYDKKNPAGIHGGDLKGITENIGYLKTLGITTIDLSPVFTSNQLFNSYEHTGITNFYETDPRLGSNSDLISLAFTARENNLKTILTFIFNQFGKQNHLVKQNPFPSWNVPDFKTYNEQNIEPVFSDPYASQPDLQNKYQTWPDMDISSINQTDADLRKYLIQHCLWWIETTGADAIRIEKTFLNTKELLTELTTALDKDYPNISVITDYESAPAYQANYLSQQLNKPRIKVRNSDYQLAYSLQDAFSTFVDYNTGINQVYKCMANDFIYQNPFNNITFIDNYKLSRAFSNADKETNQLKMMLGMLFTVRGTPQILYGTEMLLSGTVLDGSGFVRPDMPGISISDIPNAFTRRGLSSQQQEITKYLTKLIELRKTTSALNSGSFKHYIPEDGLYVYFRKTESSQVMILVNNHPTQEKRFESERFQSDLGNYNKAVEMVSQQNYSELGNIIISPKSIMILELK